MFCGACERERERGERAGGEREERERKERGKREGGKRERKRERERAAKEVRRRASAAMFFCCCCANCRFVPLGLVPFFDLSRPRASRIRSIILASCTWRRESEGLLGLTEGCERAAKSSELPKGMRRRRRRAELVGSLQLGHRGLPSVWLRPLHLELEEHAQHERGTSTERDMTCPRRGEGVTFFLERGGEGVRRGERSVFFFSSSKSANFTL